MLNTNDFYEDEILSIDLLGELPTKDISVEDTHMFYCNDIYTHNSAGEEEVITGAHVAESYKKVMVADFIVSVSRKMEDKLANTARWYIIKNRYGKDGQTFPSKMDVSIGTIEIFRPDSFEGAKTKRDMKGGEAKKKDLLKQRYTELNGFEGGSESSGSQEPPNSPLDNENLLDV